MPNIVNLYFDVSKQAIKRTDSEVVASGAINTLVANFDFCETWNGLYKFCRFEGACGVLDVAIEDDKCVIPWEAIEAPSFTMACYGTRSTDVQLTTKKLAVKVYQSVNFIADEPLPPTPQLIDLYNHLAQNDLSDLATQTQVSAEATARQIADASEAATRAAADTTLGARIDNLIVNSGEGTTKDAELVDIRTGYDGTTYNTAGSAVRGQASQLSNKIKKKLPCVVSRNEGTIVNERQIQFIHDDQNLNMAGALADYVGFAVSDYIPIDENTVGIYRTGTTVRFGMTNYAFYDVNKEFIAGSFHGETTDFEIVEYNGKQVTWFDMVEGAAYARITWQKSRPYTYYVAETEEANRYDVPKITIKGIEPLRFYEKKIVNFGDSIFGNFRDTSDSDKSISKMLSERWGATVYNAGFGGCRMAVHSNFWDAFSMHSIADSIASGSWAVQDAGIASGGNALPSYFAETVAMLKGIDWSEIDYITIGYGTNDYSGNVFVNGTEASFTNEYDYFKGALRYSLRTILAAYPHLRIVVVSPCWRWFVDGGSYSYSSDDEASKNTRNYMLDDYVDACKAVCDEMHVPYVDTYRTLGFNEQTHLHYFPSTDGVHPNLEGRKLRADRIAAKMESMF